MTRSVEDDLGQLTEIQAPDQGTLTITPEDQAAAREEEPEEPKAARERGPDGKWAAKKEKRQNAIKDNEEFRQSASKIEARIAEMETRSSRQIADLIAALRPQQQAPQVSPETTALEDQITQVGQLMRAEMAKIAAGGDEAEYYKLDRRRLSLIARAEGAQNGWGKQQQDSGLPPELAARLVQLHQEFPELAGHARWNQVAKSLREGYIAAGHPDSLATDRHAVAQAAQMLGLGPRAAPPSQRTRAAWGGPPSSGRNGAPVNGGVKIPRALLAGSGLTDKQIAEIDFSDDS